MDALLQFLRADNAIITVAQLDSLQGPGHASKPCQNPERQTLTMILNSLRYFNCAAPPSRIFVEVVSRNFEAEGNETEPWQMPQFGSLGFRCAWGFAG